MEYKELVDAFAAKCGLEQPDAKDGAVVFEIDGMSVGFIRDPAEAAVMVVAEIGEQNPDADEACYTVLNSPRTARRPPSQSPSTKTSRPTARNSTNTRSARRKSRRKP